MDFSEVKNLIDKSMVEYSIPCSDIAIVHNGEIVFRLDRQHSNLLEIAKLKNDNESYAYNAVRFGFDKLEELYKLLELGLKSPKSEIALRATRINGTQVRILNYFGTFNADYKSYLFTYTDWDCSEKYDFHPWYNNYTECDKGIRLTEDECYNLLNAVKFMLCLRNTNVNAKKD